MYFVASASIAADHPELADAASALDAYLAASEGSPVRPETAADFTAAEPAITARLLKEFERRGVLSTEIGYLCPVCDGLLGTVRGGRELWCDICDRKQSLRGKDLRGCTVFRVRTDAEKAERPAVVPTNTGMLLTIQFVAGDRGGGPRAQLDQPGEEKAIRRAIQSSRGSSRFEFAPGLFAAGAPELVERIEEGPAVLHFAGHGTERKLLLLDPAQVQPSQPVTPERLETLLKYAPERVRLAFLNLCESEAMARHLADTGAVDAAVGWAGKISDGHAVRFVEIFYRQLGNGRPLREAIDKASVALGDSDARAVLNVAPGFLPETYSVIRGEG